LGAGDENIDGESWPVGFAAELMLGRLQRVIGEGRKNRTGNVGDGASVSTVERRVRGGKIRWNARYRGPDGV
jgi:hypothetical protein